jgi:outer membrane protein OmpA-like peptidoglycan-associated protein
MLLMWAAQGLLGACASVPGTTVVLLPDEDGHVGAVVVTSGADVRRLDTAFGAVTIAHRNATPSDATPLGEPRVSEAYRDLLGAQPAKPLTFTLHFLLDSTTFAEDSREAVAQMVEAARRRKPTEIFVYGHADASGTEKRNIELSAERARVVAELLRRSDPSLDPIEVKYFGARVPAVPNDGNHPQPLNRRAEVVIL